MKFKPILLVLMLLLLVGCVQFDYDEEALEKSILGKPLPNQITTPAHEPHDHATHDHGHDTDYASAETTEHDAETAVTQTMQVVLVPSELVVGQNRVAVGLLDSDKQMIHDAAVQFQYFDLTDPDTPQSEQEADAYAVQSPDGSTTIFAQERNLDRAGKWGLEVRAHMANGKTAVQHIQFDVTADSSSVLPGDQAPRLQTSTLAAVDGDFSRITSAWEPNRAFYRLSLDAALANGKPTVLLLATPAFCRTRFCGPSYEITSTLQSQYGDAVNFIHVEVYSGLPDPSQNNWELSPVMDAFGLTTEPWVYVMDAEGQVVYRAEGVFTLDEIAAHLT